MFSIVTAPTVARLINEDLTGCVAIMRDTYLAHARGNTVNPPSVFLRYRTKPNARIIGLPAHLDETRPVSGIKWIASYPDNIRDGLPRASAVLILNHDNTGYPFACLEGAIISAARTAASATLAAEYLVATGRRVRTLAIVGAGFIARHVYQFLSGTGWTIENVLVYDTDPREAQRFVERVCVPERHRSLVITKDLAAAVRPADLVLFATVAPKPHVHEPRLFEHHPVVLHISLRDLAAELILNACNVVDDIDHVMQADTSPHLAEQLTGSRHFVTGTLADVIEGRCTVDQERTVVFSPFGLGVLDIAVGRWVYDRAVFAGDFIPIDNFFGDLQR